MWGYRWDDKTTEWTTYVDIEDNTNSNNQIAKSYTYYKVSMIKSMALEQPFNFKFNAWTKKNTQNQITISATR